MKSKRVKLVSLGSVVIVVLLLIFSQPILNSRIKARISTAAEKALHVRPTVTLGGGIAILDLIDRKVPSFSISTNSFSTTRVSNITLVGSFSEVTMPHGSTCATAKSVKVSAAIPAGAVAKQVVSKFRSEASLSVTKVTVDSAGIHVSAGVDGIISLLLVPKVSGNNLDLSIESILLFGQPLSASKVKSLTGEDSEVERGLGVTKAGNFEGRNIIHRPNATSIKGDQKIQDALMKLRDHRGRRNPPSRDDKAIVEWNSMMIVALVEAGFYLNEPRYVEAAERCLSTLTEKSALFGNATRIANASPADVPATLVDYANFIEAYLSCYLLGSVTKNPSTVVPLLDKMIEQFYDSDVAAFSLSARGQNSLFMRSSDHLDGAYASASATAISSLLLAAHILGEDRYQQVALEALAPLVPLVVRSPEHFAPLTSIILSLGDEPSEVVVTANSGELIDLLKAYYNPNTLVAVGSDKVGPLFESREPNKAYICVNYACQLPTSDHGLFEKDLQARRKSGRDG